MDDETNPLVELPAEILDEMSPGERLAYLLYVDEPVPEEVTRAAQRAVSDACDRTR
ncbi:hypothetical protein [Microtetraspora malaysiensis]|uniref:Uncharacterized protein n=1 Tax=Microtetraspora malaysiensis TaxID=161358 RepID=A0ABW6T306_9ACTN